MRAREKGGWKGREEEREEEGGRKGRAREQGKVLVEKRKVEEKEVDSCGRQRKATSWRRSGQEERQAPGSQGSGTPEQRTDSQRKAKRSCQSLQKKDLKVSGGR